MDDVELAELAKAFAAPSRVAILRRVASRALCVDAIAREIGVTPSAVSQHLRRLADAGLVRGQRVGYHVHYSLHDGPIRRIQQELGLLLAAEQACACQGPCQCVARGKGSNDGQGEDRVHSSGEPE